MSGRTDNTTIAPPPPTRWRPSLSDTLTHKMLAPASLLVACVLAWWFLLSGAGTGMSVSAMSALQFPLPALQSQPTGAWGYRYAVMMFLMWFVMMIGMMLPSAAPMILLYARTLRHNQRTHQPTTGLTNHHSEHALHWATALFVSGYLGAWGLFSAAALVIHAQLESLGALHQMMMWITVPELSGGLLIAAGLYQLTPLKAACLQHCRSPVAYLSQHWRSGPWGGLSMGLKHGLDCLGCCWLLMLLLFVGGAMNLYWIFGLTVWVLLEKYLHHYRALLWGSALGLVAAGTYLLV